MKLLNVSLFRALFHWLLLILLLALLLASGYSCLYSSRIHTICDALFSQTGEFKMDPAKGLRTEKNPESRQSYLLSEKLSFDYFPGKTLTPDFLKNRNTPFGIVCMDKGLVFWCENWNNMGKGKYLTLPMTFDLEQRTRDGMRLGLSSPDVDKYLKEYFQLPEKDKLTFPEMKQNAKSMATLLLCVLWASVFTGGLFGMIVISIGTIFLLALFQTICGSIRQPHLSFKQNCIVLLYTSFPALLITALYSLVELSVPAPQTVFMITFFIYNLFVYRTIYRNLDHPHNSEINDN